MRLQTIIMAFITAWILTGCTTFSLSRQETVIQQDDTSSAAVFRRGAEEFQSQFSDAGWLREEESQSRAQAFLSILNKGWARATHDETPQAANPTDAVSLYLARLKAQASDDPSELRALIQNDLGEALAAMKKLNGLAEPLLAPKTLHKADTLRLCVMELEHALLSARKAQSLFDGSTKRIGTSLTDAEREALLAHLQANADEIEHMKLLADTLNTLRLSNRPTS